MFHERKDIARTLARWYREGVINRRTFVYLWNREVFAPASGGST